MDLKVKYKNTKQLQKHGENLHDLGLVIWLDIQSLIHKSFGELSETHQNLTLCCVKSLIRGWMFARHMFVRTVSTVSVELSVLITENTNNPTRKWTQDINTHFTKEDIQTSVSTWNHVQHHYSLEKCKLKPREVSLHISQSD